jgi:hypothetical protein
VFIETEDGHLEDLRRIEIQESVIIGDSNPARMVLKFDRDKRVRTNQQSRTFKVT